MNEPLMNPDPGQPSYQPPLTTPPVIQPTPPVGSQSDMNSQVDTEPQGVIPWKKLLFWSGILSGANVLLGLGFAILFVWLWALLSSPDGLAGLLFGPLISAHLGPAIAGIVIWLIGFRIVKKIGLRHALLFSFAMLVAANGIISLFANVNPASNGVLALIQFVTEGAIVSIVIAFVLALVAGVGGGALTTWVMYGLRGKMATWARVAIYILSLVVVQIVASLIFVST